MKLSGHPSLENNISLGAEKELVQKSPQAHRAWVTCKDFLSILEFLCTYLYQGVVSISSEICVILRAFVFLSIEQNTNIL